MPPPLAAASRSVTAAASTAPASTVPPFSRVICAVLCAGYFSTRLTVYLNVVANMTVTSVAAGGLLSLVHVTTGMCVRCGRCDIVFGGSLSVISDL